MTKKTPKQPTHEEVLAKVRAEALAKMAEKSAKAEYKYKGVI